ncbi:MAG: carboxypeptidase-like regulatory domain-containing protein [Bacteroidota bacterium]
MKNSFPLFSILCVLAMLMASSRITAQNLKESRTTSYLTHIYRISADEAREIIRKDKEMSRYLHSPVDSFPTDSAYRHKLPPGHYVKTYAEANQQKFFITSVQDFEVVLLDNKQDLAVRVYSHEGTVLSDALVRVGYKKLRWNEDLQAYRDKKSNRRGLLSVAWQGQTAYYELSRDKNNPAILRLGKGLMNETPLYYAWIPVRFVIGLPIDGYRSVRRRWPMGTIYQTKSFFTNIGNRVVCIFDDYYCQDKSFKFQQDHNGYMVFNKPKYLPGDTVKFKAYLVNKRGKPVNDNVNVILEADRNRMSLGAISPSHPGSYSFEFVLYDSLPLVLDRSYNVLLEKERFKTYISRRFYYEDYELSGISLNLRVPQKNHYRGTPFYIYARGIDENDLQIMDGRLEIEVKTLKPDKFFGENTFVPDILHYEELPLEYNRETMISIPDSVFPAANLRYVIEVRLYTASNETFVEKTKHTFFHQQREFTISAIEDSLLIHYLENGDTLARDVIIRGYDSFGNEVFLTEGTSPLQVELSPYVAKYILTTGDFSYTTLMKNYQAQVSLSSQRSSNAIQLKVINPRGIPFSYQLYRRNKLLESGTDTILDKAIPTRGKKNYFVSLHYLWAGEMVNETYQIPLKEKSLTVHTDQPPVIYPGQKTKIEITVTDVDGNPVEGVDLTAHSLTSKFKYTPVELPYLGKLRKNQRFINSFLVGGTDTYKSRTLDYAWWREFAGLDSIEYFRFLYPEPIYQSAWFAHDRITQFAPFVMDDGNFVPIHVVYVDNRPVAFSWLTLEQPWSFRISPGYHNIRIRTREQEIFLDSIYFPEGKKLIMSLDKWTVAHKGRVLKADPSLTNSEKRNLGNYIFPYRQPNSMFSYVENGGNVFWLEPSVNTMYQRWLTTGPVAGDVLFQSPEGYTLQFKHEPVFEYEFGRNLLKMRSIDQKYLLPDRLSQFYAEKDFTEEVITRNMLRTLKHRRDMDLLKRGLYRANTYQPKKGTGILQLEMTAKDPQSLVPENLLVISHEDSSFFRLYPWPSSVFGLAPGSYHVVFLFDNNEYFSRKDIDIKANGINYYSFPFPDSLKPHPPVTSYNALVAFLRGTELPEKVLVKPESPAPVVANTPVGLQGDGYSVFGQVVDMADGMPLPGVTVAVKGTETGTLTDMNGMYELRVPAGQNTITFHFVGMQSRELNIFEDDLSVVHLEADMVALDEVVVVGYGVQRRSMMTRSVAVVTSGEAALEGKVAGVLVHSGEPVRIRGASTVSGTQAPLIVIDGVPYLGSFDSIDESMIQSMEILSGDATAIYGSRAAGGVILVNTGGAFKETMGLQTGAEAFEMPVFAGSSGTLRENFSDYAFWQPHLVTDDNGKVSFEVTFPDDITRWDTHYLSMNGNRQTGQTSGSIRSYLPLSAQLAMPRFLIQTDTVFALGKVFNYTTDSVQVNASFLINDVEIFRKQHNLMHSVIDTLNVVANTPDSIQLAYSITRDDGYFDGEQRMLAVFEPGIEETTGTFHTLDRDTTLHLDFDTRLGEVHLYARADVVNVIEEEISHVLGYRYYCNEQIASRLKVLFALKAIHELRGEQFDKDPEVRRLIKRLNKNRNQNGMWGWWKDSPVSLWISLHVMEALAMAENHGYITEFQPVDVIDKWVWELENLHDTEVLLRTLQVLKQLDASIDYKRYISRAEQADSLTFNQYLRIQRLKQMSGMEYRLDTLSDFRNETLLGNVFYSDGKEGFSLLDNDIQNTLLVYHLIMNDTATDREELIKMRNYFLEVRRKGNWRNTYESAAIIQAILPDLLKETGGNLNPELIIRGDFEQTVTDFPFEQTVDGIQNISITREGVFPVYFTAYQTFRNREPEFKSNEFRVISHFNNNDTIQQCKAGEEVKLTATVRLQKDAEYIMITVPVPAGCSFSDKSRGNSHEVHREYFRNEVVIFCEKLPAGEHVFDVELIARYAGRFNLNPAQVNLMYFPTFNANERMKKFTIE